jgi:hypothetical protein
MMFWSGLGIAAALNAALMLSPRLLEQFRLEERFLRNADALARLKSENAFLAHLATAIRTDPDFRSRLIAKELNSLSGTRIAVSEDLTFDPRVFKVRQPIRNAPQQNWLRPVVECLAESAKVRRRCVMAATSVLLLSFFCCHEGFLAGSIGGAMRGAARWLAGRYGGLNEEGCN